jgi:Family of unknown function (DUF6152)
LKSGGLPTLLAALGLFWTSAAPSHHSISVIDISQAYWVRGKVVRYRPGAPHALLELESSGPDGVSRRWIMEGPFPGRMARLIELYGGSAEAYLKPGDVVEICGFRPKAAYDSVRSYADVGIDPARFIHAQLLLMPDGQMRTWGPYGKLDNCVRSHDKVETWRQFLNRDVLAHDLWCSGLRYPQAPSAAPRTFVEAVNQGLAAPCR